MSSDDHRSFRKHIVSVVAQVRAFEHVKRSVSDFGLQLESEKSPEEAPQTMETQFKPEKSPEEFQASSVVSNICRDIFRRTLRI